jgi:exopolysaccharide biosynthesis polyprenyl glycosylphosphotransferase
MDKQFHMTGVGDKNEIPVKKAREKRLKFIMDLTEFLMVLVSIPIAYLITSRFLGYFNYLWTFDIYQFAFFCILIMISWFVLFQVISMAKLPRTQRYLTLFFHFVRVNFLNLLVLLILKFVFNLHSIPTLFIFFLVPISMLITYTIRMLAFNKLKIYRADGNNLRHAILIADSCSAGIIEKFINEKDWGYKVESIITDSRMLIDKYGQTISIHPDSYGIKDILDNQVIDEVIYSKSRINNEEVNKLAAICGEVGVIFRLQSCSSPVDSVDFQMTPVNNQKQLALVDIPSNNMPLIVKNMADIYFSITAVILLSPVFLIIALIIKLESRGPVFFKQERLGLRGRKFRLYKFRTMIVDAEKLQERLQEQNEMDGPAFKMKEDPRITGFGKFLRKTGLDEFPQLLNVITGEMSLIGPRPPLESEVKQYERWQLRRLSVKPGITCTWQITPNRNDVRFEKWMQLDLNYIDNWSLARDVKLFFKTITTLFYANGR